MSDNNNTLAGCHIDIDSCFTVWTCSPPVPTACKASQANWIRVGQLVYTQLGVHQCTLGINEGVHMWVLNNKLVQSLVAVKKY